MADHIVEILDLSKTPQLWVDPDKYNPDTTVLLFPNSNDFPSGTAGVIPSGTAIEVINDTPSSTLWKLRCQGTDTIQDINIPTAAPTVESAIQEGWFRARYTLVNGVWKLGMTYLPPFLEGIAGTGAITLRPGQAAVYDGATATSITLPDSSTIYKDSRIGVKENGGSTSNVPLICSGADTIEQADVIGTFVPQFNLHWPHSYFEYRVQGTVWRIVEKLPRDPRIGEGTFTARSNVGATYITTLSYTVQQYGKQNLYINLIIQWVTPGGNPVMDWNARWTINGVEQKARQFYNSNKPDTTIQPYSFAPWTNILVPGDLIEIQVKNNNGIGTLNTLDGTMQLMGPFV